MKEMKYKILLVEDEQNLGNVIRDYLNMSGYQTSIFYDGEAGLNAFRTNKFDLCILDIMLPKLDGFSLAQEIKRFNINIPIIFLSAKSMKEDRIKGFKIGADDYIIKPFSTEELSLRVEAILKRVHRHIDEGEAIYNIGRYVFDFPNFTLKFENKAQNLTGRECDLLKLLCINKNKVLLRTNAMNLIWGNDSYSNSRSMDVFITRLRKYLKEDPKVSILNIHGSGFKLTDEL